MINKNYLILMLLLAGVIPSMGQDTGEDETPASVLRLTLSDGIVLESGDVIDFGMISAPSQRELVAHNDGDAPLSFSEVSITGDFSMEGITTETIVNPGEAATFSLIAAAEAEGQQSGRLTLRVDGGKRTTITLKYFKMDPDKWFEDFEGGSLPDDMTFSTTSLYSPYWKIGSMYSDYMEGNQYVLYTNNGYNDEMADSPLLEFGEGEQLSFLAARYDYRATDLRISYSTDRSDWTLITTLSTDSEDDAASLPADYLGTSSYYQLKSFSVDMPAGRYYVRFTSKKIVLDNIYGGKVITLEHDAELSKALFDAKGVVNHAMQAAVTVKNVNTKAEETGGYSVKLFVDGTLAGEAATVEIPAKGEQTFTFSYTPHKAGDHEAYFTFEADDYFLQTALLSFSVAEEVSTNLVQVGEPNGTSSNLPLKLYNNYNDSETIYTAEQLGLAEGDQITRVIYRGYNTKGNVNTELNLWMECTDDETVSTTSMTDVEGMTNYFSGNYTVKKEGSYGDLADLIDLTLSEPFTYTGGNLRIRLRSEAPNDYQTVYFEKTTGNSQYIYKSNYQSNNFASMKINTDGSNMPTVYLNVAKEPTTLSGCVTLKADGSPVVEQYVTIACGNVLYEATTDADGQFIMTVVQDQLTYELRVEREGFMPFSQEVSFSEGSQVVSIQLEEAEGVTIQTVDAPEKGMVNHTLNVTLNAGNFGTEDIAADYNVQLLTADGEVLAEAKPTEWATYEEKTFTLSYMPHEAGEIEACVVIALADKTVTSESFIILIEEEAANLEGQEVVVGEANSVSYSMPFDLYYTDGNTTQTLYTPEQIGLKTGDAINSITLKGYMTDYGPVNVNIQLFLENTAEGEELREQPDEMTLVYDGEVSFQQVGSSAEHAVMIEMPFIEPFVYEGGNLRLWAVNRAVTPEDKAKNAYFETDNTGKSYTKVRDEEGNETEEWQALSGATVLYLNVDLAATMLTGCVADDAGMPLPGVSVVAESDGVTYSGETDDEGNYEILIIQTERGYTVSFCVEGYEGQSIEEVTFAEGSQTIDGQLSMLKPVYAGGETYAVCLPFDLDEEATAKAGKFYQLRGLEDSDLVFDQTGSVEAYRPYIFVAADDTDLFADFDFADIDTEVDTNDTNDGVTFVGTLCRQHLMSDADNTFYSFSSQPVESSEETHQPSTFDAQISCYVNPLCAYIVLPGAEAIESLNVVLVDTVIDEDPTGVEDIKELKIKELKNQVYDLQGRLLSSLPTPRIEKGVYIFKGKKVVMK